MERKKLIKFGIDWAAILALALCFIAFTAIKGTAFMSQSNMVNILVVQFWLNQLSQVQEF